MEYSARLLRTAPIAAGTLRADMEIADPAFTFEAGQSSLFSFPADFPLADRSRIFSFCSAPGELPSVSIATRLTPGSDFKEALSKAPPGQIFLIGEPSGDFVLPRGKGPKNVVLLAGGIGITPFRSMIRSLRNQKESPFRIFLMTVNRTGEETPFLTECQEWERDGSVEWLPVRTKEGIPPGGSRQERIYEGLARILERAGEGSLLYLAGPPAMVDAFHQSLLGQFLVEEVRIKSEMFYGYLSR